MYPDDRPQTPQPPSPNGVPPVSSTPTPSQSPLPPLTPPVASGYSNTSSAERLDYSIDYLNRIAPKEQKAVNRFAIFGLIGAVLMSILFAVIAISSSNGPSPNSQLAPIAERVQTLQTVSAAQQTHLSENQISEANAALSSTLTTLSTDLQAIMKDRGVKDTNKTALAKEKTYATNLGKTLDDAYQRGTLDRTYTSQMTYELTLLRSKVTRLKQSSKSSSIDDFCTNALTNIDLVLKAYSTFNATKS